MAATTVSAKVFIWGGRSQARILHHMLIEAGHAVMAVFDTGLENPSFASDAVFINRPEQVRGKVRDCSHFIVAVGAEHGFARTKISEFCMNQLSLAPISAIHPTAYLSESAIIGEGFQAMPHSVVHHFATIGNWCILNTNAHVDHECEIGDGVHVMGAAALAGQVMAENYVSIGTNATILPRLRLAQGTFVGAGAIVTRNTEADTVYVGSPARPLRLRNHSFFEETLLRI